MGIGIRGRIHHFRPLGVLRLWVPSLVSVEGSLSGHRGFQVLISMLDHQELFYPVIQFLIKDGVEVCFDILVDSFSLTNGLWVKGHEHMGSDSSDCLEVLPGIGCEFGVTVRQDVSWQAMDAQNFSAEYPGVIFGGFLIFFRGMK